MIWMVWRSENFPWYVQVEQASASKGVSTALISTSISRIIYINIQEQKAGI